MFQYLLERVVWILVGTLLVCRPMVGEASGFGVNLLLQVLVGVACVLHGFVVSRSQGRGWGRSGFGPILGIWFFWLGVSFWVADYRMAAGARVLSWISDGLLFLLMVSLGRDLRIARVGLRVLLGTGAILGLYGLYQWGIGLPLVRHEYLLSGSELTRFMGEGTRDLFHARLDTNRAFASFLTPNLFGGYLALLFPVALGYLLDRLREPRGSSGWGVKVHAFLILLCIGVGLLFTVSRGAFLALGIALPFLGVNWRGGGRPRRKRSVIIWILIFGCAGPVIYGLASRLKPESLSDLRSVQFRLGYWEGALRVASRHPIFGVGISNLEEHYYALKSPDAPEVQNAHNNYFQLAAETGFPGLVIFFFFWGIWLRRVREIGESSEVEDPAKSSWGDGFWMVGVATCSLSILFLRGLGRSFTDHGYQTALGGWGFLVLWIGLLGYGVVALARADETVPGGDRMVQRGLCVGVVVFWIHSLVEFGLYSMGLSQILMAVAALAIVLSDGPIRSVSVLEETRGNRELAGVCLALIPLVVLTQWVIPRGLASDREHDVALETPDVQEAIRHAAESCRLNPWNAHAAWTLVRLRSKLWRLAVGESKDQKESIWKALEKDFERTARLRPRNAGLWAFWGQLSQERALQFMSQNPSPKDRQVLINTLDSECLPRFLRAVDLYPSKPVYRLLLARMYRILQKPTLASYQYYQALELSNQVVHPRLRLSPAEVQEIELFGQRLEERGGDR